MSARRRRRLTRTILAAVLLVVVVAVLLARSGGGPRRPTAEGRGPATSPTRAARTDPARRAATGSGPAADPVARYLAAPHGPGHLAPGSDPAALPGPILIADRANSRLLIVDPEGRIRWEFPRPGDLAPHQTFLVPDDAFFTPDGRYIIATEEDDYAISVIDIATHRIVYRYGHPGVPGSAPDYVDNPDDAMMLPDGYIISSDIKNCRILLIAPHAHRPFRVYGHAGMGCLHQPPIRFGSPNGAFPMTNGDYLVTEINGDWVDEMTVGGHVVWSTHPPRVSYPSDSNEIGPDRYLTVDYSSPGQLVVFDRAGRTLYRYDPSTAPAALNHPSLALPLPNGDFLMNDDYDDRVVVLDPRTDRIVWQYGHDGVAGTRPGYLNIPDGVDLLPPYSLLGTHAATMGQP